MSGLSVGILSGLLVATVGVAAVSLSTPLPPRDTVTTVEDGAVEAVITEGEMTPEVVEEPSEAIAEQTPEVETPTAAATEGSVPEAETPAPETPSEPTPEAEAEEQSSAPTTEIPLPAGTEFNRPPPEPEAALPSIETAPQAATPQAPTLSGDVTAPSFDTTPAAQPAVGADAPAALSLALDPGAALASPTADAAPLASANPAVLSQPVASATPEVDTAALAPNVPEVPAEDVLAEDALVAEAPAEVEVAEAPEVPATEDTATLTLPTATDEPQAVPLQTPRFPTIGDGTGDQATTMPQTPDTPADEVAALSTPLFPQTSSLPQATPAPAPTPEPEPEPEPEVLEEEPLPAIQAFAAEFDADDPRALMAVVLIDEPDGRIEQSTLTRFSFPVAFAIDPLHPDAATRAAAYREAGFEVVILGSMIAEGASAADVEVALLAAEDILPEAVAVLDTPEDRIQADRAVLDAVIGSLAETGHGLVAFPRGLNAAEQSANRLGVPGATVFRLLDDEDQRATVITRFLGRAAFTASQEGAVIVVGRTRPDTVTALFSWALGGRSEGVALAPLSATITRAAGL